MQNKGNAMTKRKSSSIKIESKKIETLTDEQWAEQVVFLVFKYDRVWVGKHGVFLEREVIGKNDCFSTGQRESDGEDVLHEICAFQDLCGAELLKRFEYFKILLLDAADDSPDLIKGTRLQIR
jgi:hypothetical protein